MNIPSKLIAIARARWILRRHTAGRRVSVEAGTMLGLVGQVTIGNGVSIRKGVGIGMNGPKSVLSIGDGTYIQNHTRIFIRDRVEIGCSCAISWNVDIMDTDFHGIIELDDTTPAVTAPIAIEDRVWIGAGAKVLKGVRIGHDSIVAAGAVVTRSFPPHSLLAGVPARKIKEIKGWSL